MITPFLLSVVMSKALSKNTQLFEHIGPVQRVSALFGSREAAKPLSGAKKNGMHNDMNICFINFLICCSWPIYQTCQALDSVKCQSV